MEEAGNKVVLGAEARSIGVVVAAVVIAGDAIRVPATRMADAGVCRFGLGFFGVSEVGMEVRWSWGSLCAVSCRLFEVTRVAKCPVRPLEF